MGAFGYASEEVALMESRVDRTCSRCKAEIVIMTAADYLSCTETDLDFTLHGKREAQVAIMIFNGSYACPTCGKGGRLLARGTMSR
jgi:DNA-directed RNA polymerase subunit RPC12/RpoP